MHHDRVFSIHANWDASDPYLKAASHNFAFADTSGKIGGIRIRPFSVLHHFVLKLVQLSYLVNHMSLKRPLAVSQRFFTIRAGAKFAASD